MKTVIVGCGRVGASVAEAFDRAGHEVIIIDRSTAAFDKLDDSFHGIALRGDGTDEDVLLRGERSHGTSRRACRRRPWTDR